MHRKTIILVIIIFSIYFLSATNNSFREIVEVSGEQSGIWYGENIYQVTGDITVLQGSQLEIEPGAVVMFMADYSITANGVIRAEGTEADSIIFTSGQEEPMKEDWKKIELRGFAAVSSVFSYCLMEYSSQGLFLEESAAVEIVNCVFRENNWAIHVMMSAPLVENNIFIDNHCAVSVGTSTTNFVMKNNILDGNEIGVYLNDFVTAKIEDNILRNHIYHAIYCHNMIPEITGNAFAYNNVGVYASSLGADVKRNVFNNCDTAILCENTSALQVTNNTITECIRVIEHDDDSAHSSLINNIITDNMHVFWGGAEDVFLSNNLFYNNQQNLPSVVDGLGEIYTENYNGDDCDIYYNIFEEPDFVNPPAGDYHLLAGSAAINSGNDNHIYNDPDGTINDCGAFYYPLGAELVNAEFMADKLFAAPLTEIQFTNLSGGAFESCLWDFGDGQTSTGMNPLHAYEQPGIYSVQLTISGEGGTDIEEKVSFLEIMPQQELAGAIHGTLEGNICYRVQGDVFVEQGETLTIGAGSCFRFMGSHSIIIEGELVAVGTAEEPIRFLSADKQPQYLDWDGIQFINSSEQISVLTHVHISNSREGIYSDNSQLGLTNCQFKDNNIALRIFNDSYLAMTGCSVTDSFTDGMLIYDGASGEITNCYFSNDNVSIFIYFTNSHPSPDFSVEYNTFADYNGYAVITSSGNEIAYNVFNDFNRAVRYSGSGNLIHHNVFNNGELALMLDGVRYNHVYNNTFVNCTLAIAGEDWDENPPVVNNIFMNNETALEMDNNPQEIYHNLFWNNVIVSNCNTPSWLGICDNYNYNGDVCDQGFNLFQSPDLCDPQNFDFSLLMQSCCIDAGDPDPFYNDPDGTVSDIGAYYYLPTAADKMEIECISSMVVSNYPNPFNPETAICFMSADNYAQGELNIYNVRGQVINKYCISHVVKGKNQFSWNGVDKSNIAVASGIYYYQITCGAEVGYGKMLLLK